MRAALLCASALLPLAGCVNMSGLGGSSKHSCAAPEGVACDSMSGTYANAVHNNLPSQRSVAAGTPVESVNSSSTHPAEFRRPLSGTLPSVANASPGGDAAIALRSQARVLRLWTKPWEDADGDLWDQGYVYVQVDVGRWQIDHVRQRIRDQYAPLRPPPAAAPAAPSSGAPPAGLPPSEPDSAAPAEGAVQRPAPFNAFPSLAQPPVGLGARPQ